MTSSIGSRPSISCSERKSPGTRWVLMFQQDFSTIQKTVPLSHSHLFTVASSFTHHHFDMPCRGWIPQV
jgi:hypothetical protein